MPRPLLIAVILSGVSVPAFACDWHKSVSTQSQPSTVASQPVQGDQTPQKPNDTSAHAPS
jgi:hypothetical protein